ncbi:MAG: AraC family transcriptional regulator [Labilithrix sp.]
MNATVSIRSFLPLVVYARRAGYDAATLLADAGLTTALLAQPELRVPAEGLQRAFTRAVARFDDPTLGLVSAELIDFRTLGSLEQPTDFLAMHHMISSATVGAALEAITRSLPVAYGPIDVALEHGAATSHLHFAPVAGAPILTEHIVAALLCALRHSVARPFEPVEVMLPHAAPPDPSAHQRVLSPVVRFDAPRAGFAVRAADLAIPLATSKPFVHETLEHRVSATLHQLTTTDFVASVRAIVLRELPDGNPLADNVAARLGLSTRTLARYLAAEGTTHHGILDQVRMELTTRYLRERRPMTEIARLVGFSSLSPFHRAFRRWYGCPPAEWHRESHSSE